MRTESCRRCGAGLEINKRCEICNIPIQYFCHKCSLVTENQIHVECIRFIAIQKQVK